MPYVTRGPERVFYERVGEGPAVLWHTGGCGDHTMWRDAGYVDALGGFTHLLLDHRGHGRSSVPAGDAHRMVDYVGDVVAVLDDARVERAAIVGYSFGVDVAFATGLRHAERVDAIVGLDGVPQRERSVASLQADQAEVLSRGTVAVIEEMATFEDDAPPDWLMANLLTTPTEVFAGCFDAIISAIEEWPAVPGPDAPILLVIAPQEDDEWVTLARDAVEALANATMTVLPARGHLGAFWRSDLVVPLVREFLADPARGATTS